MSLSSRDIAAAVVPLRLVFWGGLLVLIDINFSQTTNGRGWSFDILNDLVGMILITWGVFRLGQLDVHDRYRQVMTFIKVVSLLSCFRALLGHFIFDSPTFLDWLLSLIGLAGVVATVLFCIAMRWLAEGAGFQRSAESWNLTMWLFVVIYLVPIGGFYVVALFTMMIGESFHFNLGGNPLVLVLLVAVLAIPMIHFFLSTSRLKFEAEQAALTP